MADSEELPLHGLHVPEHRVVEAPALGHLLEQEHGGLHGAELVQVGEVGLQVLVQQPGHLLTPLLIRLQERVLLRLVVPQKL